MSPDFVLHTLPPVPWLDVFEGFVVLEGCAREYLQCFELFYVC